MRFVAPATAPIRANISIAGRRSPAALRRKRWSYANTPSSPCSSAACATVSDVATSSRNDGSVSPSFTPSRGCRSALTRAPGPGPRRPPRRPRPPSSAATIGTAGRYGAPSMRPSNAARSGRSSTSSSSTRPPDTTTCSGSKMLTRPTSPIATRPAYSSTTAIASAAPAWATSPTSTPVMSSTTPLARGQHRRCRAGRRPLATERAERGARRQRLPVPALTARAERTVGIDLEVADLGAEAVRAAQHLAPGDHTTADAGAERDQEHLGASPRRAVHQLRDRGDVGVVVDHRGEADDLLQSGPHRSPEEGGDVRRVVDGAVVVDHARGADAQRARLGALRAEVADRAGDLLDDLVERARRRDAALVDDRAVGIDQCDAEVGAAEVDAERRGVTHRHAPLGRPVTRRRAAGGRRGRRRRSAPSPRRGARRPPA